MISAHSSFVEAASVWLWSLAPIAGLVLAAAAYAAGFRRLTKASRRSGPRGPHAVAFYAGLISLAAALLSPLDRLAEALFSAHMLQHLLLVIVAAPLLVYGKPSLPFALGTPRSIRRQITRATRSRKGRRVNSLFLNPLLVGILHATVLWIWHLPGPYQAAIANPAVHYAEHLTFFVTALLFWRLVLAPGPAGRYLPTTLLVLGTGAQSGALGALLSFATFELYPVHAASSAALGVNPLEDQQVAGAIMWIPAGGVYLMTIVAVLLRAFRDLDRRMPARDKTPGEPLVEAGGRT